jgi:hypothetical protein
MMKIDLKSIFRQLTDSPAAKKFDKYFQDVPPPPKTWGDESLARAHQAVEEVQAQIQQLKQASQLNQVNQNAGLQNHGHNPWYVEQMKSIQIEQTKVSALCSSAQQAFLLREDLIRDLMS